MIFLSCKYGGGPAGNVSAAYIAYQSVITHGNVIVRVIYRKTILFSRSGSKRHVTVPQTNIRHQVRNFTPVTNTDIGMRSIVSHSNVQELCKFTAVPWCIIAF